MSKGALMNHKLFALITLVVVMVLAIPVMAQESNPPQPADAICRENGLSVYKDPQGVVWCVNSAQTLFEPAALLKAEVVQAMAPTATPANTLVQVVPTAAPTVFLGENPLWDGTWDIQYFEGATPQMLAWDFGPLQPELWPTFPNVDNPAANFLASDGLEYGEDESQFCGAAGDQCELVIPAGGYAIISGDYDLPGYDTCTGEVAKSGCTIIIPNLGEISSALVGELDNAFIIVGRIWNGDELPTAIVAALSHVVNNMTNGQSALNPNGSVNAGANCSVRTGCQVVRAAFVSVSGNEALFKGVMTYVVAAQG